MIIMIMIIVIIIIIIMVMITIASGHLSTGCLRPTQWLDLLFLLLPYSSHSTGLNMIIMTVIITVTINGRFDYYLIPCLVAAASWCLLVCSSRLYLGMHRYPYNTAAGMILLLAVA